MDFSMIKHSILGAHMFEAIIPSWNLDHGLSLAWHLHHTTQIFAMLHESRPVAVALKHLIA